MSLSVEKISKSFGGTRALDSVSLTVEPGQVHALVGHNGSGKSTLIKVLAGFCTAEPGGVITVDGQTQRTNDSPGIVGVRFVHQNLGLVDDMTVAENLALGDQCVTDSIGRLRKSRERERGRQALDRINAVLELDRPVSKLRPAERTAVALARAMITREDETRYLVLDEPTAVMPKDDVENLFKIVKDVALSGVGVLYVSHHLEEIFRLADVVTVLRNGKSIGTHDIDELTLASLTRLIVGADVAVSHLREDLRHAARDAVPVLQVAELSGDRVHDVSFYLGRGEIVGIAGVTGSGREQVLQMLYGGIARSGSVVVDGTELPANQPHIALTRRIGLVPAERRTEALFEDLTVRENIFPNHRGGRLSSRVDHRRERARADEWLDRLRVTPRDGSALIKHLSGGNQQKIVFARALQTGPTLLLLDEPTQGVDIGARKEIHDVIRFAASDGCSVLVASTDDEELEVLCDRVLVMNNGRICAEYAGADIVAGRLVASSLAVGS